MLKDHAIGKYPRACSKCSVLKDPNPEFEKLIDDVFKGSIARSSRHSK